MGADDPLPGEAAAGGGAHGGADGAGGAGVAGELGYLAVGQDAAARDAADDGVELVVEAADQVGLGRGVAAPGPRALRGGLDAARRVLRPGLDLGIGARYDNDR